jgi:prophage antirepressor-like protein
MNNPLTFNNTEFGTLEVIMIDRKEYFPAIQCAEILGYSNPRDAIIKHCNEKGVVNRDVLTEGGMQAKKYITEGNLYRLIVRSNLPAAEKFESWIMDEVLPSIRKTGSYSISEKEKSPAEQQLTELKNMRLQSEIERERLELEYERLRQEIAEEKFFKMSASFRELKGATTVSNLPPELMMRVDDVFRWWNGLPMLMKPIEGNSP